MNQRDVEFWVKHLRSGKFPQGRYSLLSSGNYCCLGVLCEISKLKHTDATGGFEIPDGLSWTKFLDKKYNLDIDYKNISLMTLNDVGYETSNGTKVEDPLTFDEIADVLEAVYIHKVLE